MSRNLRGVTIAALIGGATFALFFAGQVFTYAARWAGRAISGAALIFTALIVAYATYQLYSGWSTASEASTHETGNSIGTETSPSTGDPNSIDEVETKYLDEELTEEEFERELDSILEKEEEL